jgi:hypothetical protein
MANLRMEISLITADSTHSKIRLLLLKVWAHPEPSGTSIKSDQETADFVENTGEIVLL